MFRQKLVIFPNVAILYKKLALFHLSLQFYVWTLSLSQNMEASRALTTQEVPSVVVTSFADQGYSSNFTTKHCEIGNFLTFLFPTVRAVY